MREQFPEDETPFVGGQLRQFALKQIDQGLTYLNAAPDRQDEAIHETRRCLKRLRALLRLLRPQLAEMIFDRDNLYLRNIGRQLSALRDAAVVEETLAALKKEHPTQLSRNDWRELKQHLIVRSRPSPAQTAKRMTAVAANLRTMRARLEKWTLDFADPAVLQQGIHKAFRRGQRLMEQALKEPTAEAFHEWRKQVNHLRHQLQILQTLKLGKVKTILPQCKSLAEVLGRKNDLAVLLHHLPSKHRQALETLIQASDAALAAEAIELGQQLYARKPKAFIRPSGREYLT